MPDLADFLLARIAEDEDVAEKAVWDRDVERVPGRWVRSLDDASQVQLTVSWLPEGEGGQEISRSTYTSHARHIAHFDPARILAECDAKRRIVTLERRLPEKDFRPIPPPVDTPVLRALALPYADHPDYREEWRP